MVAVHRNETFSSKRGAMTMFVSEFWIIYIPFSCVEVVILVPSVWSTILEPLGLVTDIILSIRVNKICRKLQFENSVKINYSVSF